METVTLKNGAEEPRPLVLVVWNTLRTLQAEEPLTLFDAIAMARTGEPQPYSAARLEANGLTQNGVMHDSTANVIRCAAQGEDLGVCLVSPLKEAP